MVNLSAQNELTKIAYELKRQGYTVEIIKNHQDTIQYVIFYKSRNEIYGIESSDTFKLDDVIDDLPNIYFHIGRFEKYKSKYGLWFFTIETEAEEVINKINESNKSNLFPHENDLKLQSEFEMWKLKRGRIKWNG